MFLFPNSSRELQIWKCLVTKFNKSDTNGTALCITSFFQPKNALRWLGGTADSWWCGRGQDASGGLVTASSSGKLVLLRPVGLDPGLPGSSRAPACSPRHITHEEKIMLICNSQSCICIIKDAFRHALKSGDFLQGTCPAFNRTPASNLLQLTSSPLHCFKQFNNRQLLANQKETTSKSPPRLFKEKEKESM